MEIKITRTIEKELKLKKEVWSFFSRRLFLAIALLTAVGIILVVDKGVIMNKECGFWKPASCIGIAFIFTALLRLLSLIRSKEKYVNSHELLFALANKAPATELIINDDGIRFNGRNVASAFNWQFFLFYKVYKNFIILNRYNGYNSSLIIGRNELSDDEFKDLIFLISKNKIQQK